jgi:AraC-like DNA-binding protein
VANSTLRVLPDGSWDFVCHIDPHSCTLELVGPMSRAVLIPLSSRSRHYGVRFVPGTYFTPLNHDLSNIVGKTVPLDQLVPGVAVDGSKPIIPQLVMIVEHITAAKYLQRNSGVDEALQVIKESFSSPDFAVSQLTKAVSIRTIERRFRRYVGVSPKRLLRIYRQLAVAEMLLRDKQPSLSEIASDFSYVDQAHMTNDLRLPSCTTPQALSDEFDEFLQYDWPYNTYTT